MAGLTAQTVAVVLRRWPCAQTVALCSEGADVAQGQMMTKARPTMESSGMALNRRESSDAVRLSPMTHTLLAGTTSGPKVDVIVPSGR